MTKVYRKDRGGAVAAGKASGVYQISHRSLKDSDGRGIGDPQGSASRSTPSSRWASTWSGSSPVCRSPNDVMGNNMCASLDIVDAFRTFGDGYMYQPEAIG